MSQMNCHPDRSEPGNPGERSGPAVERDDPTRAGGIYVDLSVQGRALLLANEYSLPIERLQIPRLRSG
jgi:hypothetical protein